MIPEFSIQQLFAEDWSVYKAIRLEALSRHPNFFSPGCDEFLLLESDWRARLINKNTAVFGLYAGSEIIGLTGVFCEGINLNNFKAHFIMSYIRADFRRKGLSEMFFDARLKWVNGRGDVSMIIIAHREGNLSSEAAIRKHKFLFTERLNQKFLDGTEGSNIVYKIQLGSSFRE